MDGDGENSIPQKASTWELWSIWVRLCFAIRIFLFVVWLKNMRSWRMNEDKVWFSR